MSLLASSTSFIVIKDLKKSSGMNTPTSKNLNLVPIIIEMAGRKKNNTSDPDSFLSPMNFDIE